MIVRGFQPVAWVAAIGTAALGCYMLSLQVAAERSELARLESRIVRTQQDIRSLQTEVGTRGRLQQLEHWNAEVLALSAPIAGQFLESGLTLARFDTREESSRAHEQVRLASAQTEPAASSAPIVRQAVAQASASLPDPAAQQPLVRRASLEMVPAAQASSLQPATLQARSTSLLDEATLREIGVRARAETAGDGDD